MKKSLSVLVAGAMVSSMFASFAFAAELTTQEKYDALKAAGIFEGTGNGSELNAGMTREQLAKIIALVKKFDVSSTASGFTDVASDRWSAGVIAAVAKAQPMIMDGTAPGVFNPEGTVTVEQLATVVVRALGLQVEANPSVTGKVSDWAKGYVAAVVKAGLLPAQTDYTTDAPRSLLVETTYSAVQAEAAPKVKEAVAVDSKKVKVTFSDNGVAEKTLDTALESGKATDVTVTYKDRSYTVSVTYKAPTVAASVAGAKKIKVEFGSAVDSSKVTFAVKNGSNPVNTSKQTWADDKKSVVLEFANALPKAEYTVTVTGATEAAVDLKVSVEAEKVAKIEFTSDKAVLDRAGTNQEVTAGYKVYNQYNEDVTSSYASSLNFSAGRGSVDAGTAGVLKLTLTGDNKFAADEKIAASVIHPSTSTFASSVLTVSAKAQVASVEFTGLVHNVTTKKDLTVDSTANEYVVVATAKDQYGNAIAAGNANFLDTDLVVTVSDTTVANVTVAGVAPNQYADFETVSIDGSNKIGLKLASAAKAGTITLTAISKSTGNKATFEIKVGDRSKSDAVSLTAPELAVANETFDVPFSVLDQFGAEMTKASDLNTSNATKGFQTLTATNASDIKFVQDDVTGKAKLQVTTTGADAKTVLITAVSRTGKVATLSISVQKAKTPTVISATKDITLNLAKGATSKLKIGNLVVLDQYNRSMTPTLGADNYIVTLANGTAAKASLSGTVLKASADEIVITALEKGSTSVTAKLQKWTDTNTNGTVDAGETTDVVNSSLTFNVNVVEKADIASYEVADITTMYATNDTGYGKEIVVNGVLADGSKVKMPMADFTVTSAVYYNTTDGKIYGDQAFADTFGGANKEKAVPVVVTVNGASGPQTIVKTVTFSNAAKEIKTLALKSVGTTVGTSKVESAGLVSELLSGLDTDAEVRAMVRAIVVSKDQYGVEWTTNEFTDAGIIITPPSGKTLATIVAGDKLSITAVNGSNVISFTVVAKANPV